MTELSWWQLIVKSSILWGGGERIGVLQWRGLLIVCWRSPRIMIWSCGCSCLYCLMCRFDVVSSEWRVVVEVVFVSLSMCDHWCPYAPMIRYACGGCVSRCSCNLPS